MMQLSEFSYFA